MTAALKMQTVHEEEIFLHENCTLCSVAELRFLKMVMDQPKPDVKSANRNGHWTDRVRNALPTREALAAHPWLKPIAHRVLAPELWRSHHESIARGVGIGLFWAFVIPLAQVIFAAIHCVWWRGNIPIAAAMTLITNPFTVGFWLWLAYKAGSLILPVSVAAQPVSNAGVLAWIQAIGWPTVAGMGLFGIGGGFLGYVLVNLGWRIHVALKRHKTNG